MGLGGVQQRPQRPEPQVRRRRHRVAGQGRVPQPRRGVGGHGGPDVAALGVGEHQYPGRAQVGDRAFQDRVARRAVRLEECDLRLDDGEARERLHADGAEGGQPVGVGRQPPGRQQFRMRIDTQAQRPARGDRLGQPRPEAGHAQWPSSVACSSCRDRTPMSPRMPASMPCTAAEAPCTVVTHGMFICTAAERIS